MPTPQPATSQTPARRITANQNDLVRKEFASTDYWLTVPKAHTADDLMNPDYYMHFARKLRTNTLIWANAEDGSFFGLLRVIASSDTWAKCEWVIFNASEPFEGDPTPDAGLYKIDHTSTGWRVIHRDTGKVLAEKLGKRSDAEGFVELTIAAKTKQ